MLGFARVAGLSILTAAAFVASMSVTPADADEIRIGVPLAQTGGAARWGTFSLRGAELAAKEINESGGVLGNELTLIPADTQCIPAEGVSALQRLINIDEVDLILGEMCSSVMKAMQPIVEEAQLPIVAATTSDPEITHKAGVGGYKWTFRNYPTDEIRTLILMENAAEIGLRKIAMLAIDNDFGRAAVAFTQKYQPRFPDVEITSIDYFSLKDNDFRPILSKMKSDGAEALVLYALSGDTIKVLAPQMRELELAGKVRVMGVGDLTHPDNVEALPDVLEGAIEATSWVPTLENARSQAFVASYKEAYGDETPNFLAYTYWETTHLIAEAIENAGSADKEEVRTALTEIEYDGVMGKVRFDDHNQANVPMLLLEIKDGEVVQLGSFYSQPDYAE